MKTLSEQHTVGPHEGNDYGKMAELQKIKNEYRNYIFKYYVQAQY